MALKNHVQIDVIATLECAGCGEVCDANEGSERSAESMCLGHAEADRWEEINGRVYCYECARLTKK